MRDTCHGSLAAGRGLAGAHIKGQGEILGSFRVCKFVCRICAFFPMPYVPFFVRRKLSFGMRISRDLRLFFIQSLHVIPGQLTFSRVL